MNQPTNEESLPQMRHVKDGGGECRVPLGTGKYAGKYAIVDPVDYERVQALPWAIKYDNGQIYAKHRKQIDNKRIEILLHRFVMNAGPGDPLVMHLNGDGLDCRRSNLEFGDKQKNGASHHAKRANSSSRFRGVRLHRPGSDKPWLACIKAFGKTHHLGKFAREEDAAAAYDAGALLHFGKYASLNFPAALPSLEGGQLRGEFSDLHEDNIR